ncbi:MAG: hypothetical protein OMM_06700 [Candidatus Magnetoglobus multicellularis str. Araruama]|uniref:MotA/TolQ/ExbB proton channel domain-containing protein n=1 Tax=Candidatus Magnetoglobus multicellularis str. Araruama TaxID=890399 RepID=A0A1V1PGB3_9BACT|nr:MAG: hypothetical protein OMM_06700 [Candidatus Magnetoglobus multicellularis str. Araruama]
MNALSTIYQYVGFSLYGLLPMSIASLSIIFYIIYATIKKQSMSVWVEIILAAIKELAPLLGFLGTVYALALSFQIDNPSTGVIRKQMFQILSTGLWSTFAGIIVSIEAFLGLIMLKRI